MTTIADLDDVFSDDEEPKVSEADLNVPKGEPEEPEKEEPEKQDDPAPPAEEEQPKMVPLAALEDERRKRQEIEAKLANQSKQEVEVPDPVEDPEGYQAFMTNEHNKMALTTKIELSRDILKGLDGFGDYEDMEMHFLEMVNDNPMLAQKMAASPNPAKFAYETAKKDKEVKQYASPGYRKKLEEEIRAKILAETQPAKSSKVEVPDLTRAAAAQSNTNPKEGLEDLDEIMEGSPF